MIHDAAVDLLGHALIEAAIARLHVEHRDLAPLGRVGGQATVGIAQDQQRVRLDLGQGRVGPRDDLADSLAGRGARGAQEVVRLAQLEILEEDLVQLVVVVLAGVHRDVIGRLVQRGQDAGQADNLGAGAEDGGDFHVGSPCFSTGRNAVSGFASSKTWLDQKSVTRSPLPTFSMEWV